MPRPMARPSFCVALLASIVAAGGCGSAGVASPRLSATGTHGVETPTANPTSDIEAAVRQFIAALVKSGESGDPSPLDALVVKDSTAYSNDGVFARAVRDSGVADVVLRIDIDESSWRLEPSIGTASVSVSWRAWGHPAAFPAMTAEGPDVEGPSHVQQLELTRVRDEWLVESFS